MKPFLSFCLMLSFFLSLRAQPTVLVAGRLIDGTGAVVDNPAVVIEGERIVEVTTPDRIPGNARLIDLGNYTLLPGLIDLHVHPNITEDDYQVAHLRSSSAAKALLGLRNVQDLLHAGWTTLRVAGDADVGYANLEVRNAINAGLFVGPRIFGAGHYLSITGGGGDINFISHEQGTIADGLVVDGPEEMRKAVRREIKYGSDWIKLLVTGAFMSANDNPRNVHFSPEELRVAVEEASRRDVPVMAHAHGAEGIKMAVRAGARTIEHGSFLDEEGIELMIEHGAYLIPTFTVGYYIDETLADSKALSKAVELGKEARKNKLSNIKLAFERGVKFGLGTDWVGWPAEFSAMEFKGYLELGMSPMQAIECATRINAEILRKEQDLGTVEAGKLADIIAVADNPLEDISELQRVKFVMLGGRVVKRE